MSAAPEADKRRYTKRRRVPRRAYSGKIGLLIKGKYIIDRALEVGEGGMLIYSSTQLDMQQMVVLSFQIPGTAPCVVRASVKYILLPNKNHKKIRYGLQFNEVDFNIKRLIRNYVSAKTHTSDVAR